MCHDSMFQDHTIIPDFLFPCMSKNQSGEEMQSHVQPHKAPNTRHGHTKEEHTELAC